MGNKTLKYDHEFFRTTTVADFKMKVKTDAPEGYPASQPDDKYTKTCFKPTYQERKQAFIEFALNSPSSHSAKGIFYELVRLNENHGPIHEGIIWGALDYIDVRKDCADFVMTGVLRLYYQFKDHSFISEKVRNAIKQSILDFKYWPDEPGIDSMCYWTENHHMIFSTCEYLAGQLFPHERFTNSGHTGIEKMDRAKKRIDKWFELRFYTGFSEWLSNVYFDESMPPLINLLDLADDKLLRKKAKDTIDLMFYDMALNSYYGQFSCTHGRTYTKEKIDPLQEDTIDTEKVAFGLGKFTNKNNMVTPLLVLSDYEIPQVLVDIANSTETLENKQRVSIRFEDAKKWGYHKKNVESAMGLLSFGGYTHPKTFNHLAILLNEFNWWNNKFFQELKPFQPIIKVGRHIGLTTLAGAILKKDMSRNSMTEANLYTYRTRNYMLSTAQDYMKSMGGDQHHIWQATLNNHAVVFTTHPGGYGDSAPDAYWHGNGFMPKSVQHKNVNITIYNTPKMPTVVLQRILDFTHAFFPKDRFDKVVEKNGWIFGKSDDGYVAIRSQNPYEWKTEGEWSNQELIVKGRRNIYVTELGNKDTYGSFEAFVEKVSASKIIFNGLKVQYDSPSIGLVCSGWKKQLKVNNEIVSTENYNRYSNSTSETKFMSEKIEIEYKGEKLIIER